MAVGERKLIGYVGVDSGQIIITDPCYAVGDGFIDERDQGGELDFDAQLESGLYPYSYSGACSATTSEDSAGSMAYKAGHEGAGVVASSGFGDGSYPVYVEYSDEGDWGVRVKSMTVEFINGEETSYD